MSQHPYRDGMAAGIGCALAAGLVVGMFDVIGTIGAAGGLGFAPALLALYAVPALLVGLGSGLIAASVKATWGDGAVGRARRRLIAEPELDRSAAAAVMATVVALAVLVVFVMIGAKSLVANRERYAVGAILLGVAVAGVLPFLALGMLPVYRVARHLAPAVPRIGPVPRVVLLVLAGVALVISAGLFFVFNRLDWRVLNLPAFGMIAALPTLTVAFGLLAYGPLAGLRARIPARGIVVAVSAGVALLLPVITLLGTPSEAVQAAVIDHSTAGAKLVNLARAFIDRDGDGYSPFFGGPDCDDGDKDVNPGAREIRGNGKDDDCTGGDRAGKVDVQVAGGGAGTGSAAGAGSGSGAVAPAPHAAAFDGNVLFIMIDTLRADRLGVSGYRRDGKSLSPRLDAFAAQAVHFRRTYAQAPNTPRSVPSMMSSRYPSQIAVDKLTANYPRLDDANVLLFEALQAAKLATLGYASHFYFCHDDECPSKRVHSNILQGFDSFDDTGAEDIAGSNHDSAAPRIVPRVVAKLGELATSKQKFAMFVHLFEPHSTYMEHDGWEITEHGTAALAQKYDYEIAFMDGYLGKVFDALDQTGLTATTMVVIVSDHGEAFGVHRMAGEQMFFHGQTLYSELIHVPLMFRIPGVAPRAVDDVVEVKDVAPTILDLLGVAPPPTWKGKSLALAIAGKGSVAAPAFAELISAPEWDHTGKSMISADGQWHLFLRDGRYELYDLTADPEEKNDLWDSKQDVGAPMKTALEAWNDALGDP